jgi:hypothetical protein
MARLLLQFVPWDPKRDDPFSTFFADEPDEAPRFHALVGRILALWGRTEIGLVMLIAQIAHLDGVPVR